MNSEIPKEEFRIMLVKRADSFVWIRNDGRWVSPAFSTQEAAHYMAGKIPFLTDEEWKEFYSITESVP